MSVRPEIDSRPVYWCPHWQTLNVATCESCEQPQVTYFRSAYVESLAEALAELTDKHEHLLSEWRHGRDRGDHLVYCGEWEDFDRWQRGERTAVEARLRLATEALRRIEASDESSDARIQVAVNQRVASDALAAVEAGAAPAGTPEEAA